MKKRKRYRLLILLALALVAAAAGWWLLGDNENPSALVPPTAQVIRRDFASSVLATGAVKPQVGAEVRVGARISGRVERLLANIGDFVKRGQVIAELQKDDLAATVDQSSAELVLAQARLSSVETLRPREVQKAEAEAAQWLATLKFARKELVRQDALVEAKVTAQEERDRAQEALSVAQAQYAGALKALDLARETYTEDLKQAKAEIARARAALANARVRRSYATITAPIDGVIGSVSTQEGETVTAGLQAPTFVTILDLTRLQVDAYVDEVDIGKVKLGLRAVFTVDAFPAKEFEGKVTAIYPNAVIQENVVYYDVVVDIRNPQASLLRPEMTCSVTIFLGTRKGVPAVPAKAVKRERGRNVVYLLSGGRPVRREVKVGWKEGQWIEIAAGITDGQTVLLETPSGQNTKP